MQKRDDSVRSLGQASLGTDRPTRDKIKAQADAAGLAVSEYLRYLADNAGSGQQGQMLPVSSVASVKKDTSAILQAFRAVSIILKSRSGHLTDQDLDFIKQSPLCFLTDDEIIGTAKEVGKSVSKQFTMLPGQYDEVSKSSGLKGD